MLQVNSSGGAEGVFGKPLLLSVRLNLRPIPAKIMNRSEARLVSWSEGRKSVCDCFSWRDAAPTNCCRRMETSLPLTSLLFFSALFYYVASQSLNAGPAFYCLCVTERDADDSILLFGGGVTPVMPTPAPDSRRLLPLATDVCWCTAVACTWRVVH